MSSETIKALRLSQMQNELDDLDTQIRLADSFLRKRPTAFWADKKRAVKTITSLTKRKIDLMNKISEAMLLDGQL